MKTKLLLLMLLVTFADVTSQSINVPVSGAVVLISNNYPNKDSTAIVPIGKLWQVSGWGVPFGEDVILLKYWKIKVGSNDFSYFSFYGNPVFPAGTEFYCRFEMRVVSFIEYDLDAQTLAYNIPIDSKIQLFPNPTDSLVKLNSDKNYVLEVYNMQGQRLMKTVGNVIDLSNLSSAMYILKAYDKIDKTMVTYKVIKH